MEDYKFEKPKDKNTDVAIVTILSELLKEQKRMRSTETAFRVINLLFFFLLPIVLIFAIITGIISGISNLSSEISNISENEEFSIMQPGSNKSHSALVEYSGVIGDGVTDPDRILAAIDRAFRNENSVGVIFRINSPGGSPTISDNIYTGIKDIRKKYPEKPFVVVGGDVVASGGYYMAVAADKIFVNQSTIIGSIGVIYSGFGVKSLMEKIGVSARIVTSGERKAMLNPFEDVNPDDVVHLQKGLDAIHKRFIEVVKEGRGDKLKSNDIFNGLFWNGEEAIRLGLADGIGSAQQVAKDELGEENIVKYPVRKFSWDSIILGELKLWAKQAIQGATGSPVGSFNLY